MVREFMERGCINMKRFFLALLVSFWTLYTSTITNTAFAQTTTPNRGLVIPPGAIPGSWGESYNNNFIELDLSKIPRVTNATKPLKPEANEVVVVTDALNSATCTTGGGTSQNTCQWTGSAWVVIGGGTGGGGGVTDFNQLSGTASDAQIPNLNVLSTGLTGSRCVQTDAAGLLTVAAGPCPTVAATGTTGNITVSGAGVIDLGATAVQTDQANTYGNFDQNFAGAASLTVPAFPGAAPAAGRIAYDSSSTVFKGGIAGVPKTFAMTDQIQPLNPALSQIAGLTPTQNSYILYRGGTWTVAVRSPCSGAGQATNFDATTGNEGCVTTGAGGISGLTPNRVSMAVTPSTLTDSPISVSAGTTTVNGPLVVGAGPFYLDMNTSALTADRIWTIQNIPGTILPAAAAGTFTNDHVLKAVVSGGIVTIADGGTAGIGDQTASSVATFTNKTINPEATGNQITQVSVSQFDFAACPDGSTAGNLWDADATGLAQPTAACNDTGSIQRPTANFSGTVTNAMIRTFRLPKGWTGNIDLKARYISAAASPTGNVRWCVETVSRAVGQTWDGTFNSPQCNTDAVAAQNIINEWSQTTLDVTGAAAEEDFTIRVSRIGGDGADTNNDDAKMTAAYVTLRWIQQSQ